MNAEQPPMTTPTRFLLECSAAGYPFPIATEDPFNRCIPLTPPLPNQQHSSNTDHQYPHHVFTQPVWSTPTSYYSTQQPHQMTIPIKQQYQPPTPPPATVVPPTFINQSLPSTVPVTNDTTTTTTVVTDDDNVSMANSTTTTSVVGASVSPEQPFQHPSSTTTTCMSNICQQQIELPPTPPKTKRHTASVGRKRRVSVINEDNEDEEGDGQRKKLLERNRMAASKCRQKKKEWMKDLEIRSEQVSSRNKELKDLLAKLREESMFLRTQLLTHSDCSCTMVQAYLQRSSARLSLGNMSHHSATITVAADTVAEMMNYPHQPNSFSSSPSFSYRSSPETH